MSRSRLCGAQSWKSDERVEPANALAIRTPTYTYIAYNDGERELYDLDQDPGQLQSIEPAPTRR